MDKKKKIFISVAVVEVAILIFCLVVAILDMTNFDAESPNANILNNGVFIGTLQNKPTLFFLTILLPVFIIFLIDGIYLIVYAVKKPSTLSDKERDSIKEQAKAEARAELEAEMKAEAEKDKK
ncbi:MAG: hypothetical protein LKF75_00520 [Bacilli bacterium]|jgi:uncharacterized membrane protein|nr:hypothetical protein [Bacilli bacterium]MCH4210283.1 hypothetical protein [Bacilli bacterium]MCH4228185.1 hypothetical protein [Bacilli bacterium]MCH4277461.1 hypothetical protein [Bacilli bacterium]MCI2054637.1 hypothetical protein [Bacilli bacterium]